MLQQALAYFQAGQFDKAERETCKGLVSDPDNVELLTLLGEAMQRQGNIQGALDEWRTAQALAPDTPRLAELIACAELSLGETRTSAPGIVIEADTPDKASVSDSKTPFSSNLSRLLAGYLVGLLVTLPIGWFMGLVEVFVYRFHVLVAIVIGFLCGRSLDLLVGATRRGVVTTGDRALLGALMAVATYAVTLYVPYHLARQESEASGPGLLGRLQGISQQRPVVQVEEGVEFGVDVMDTGAELDERATRLDTSSFSGYLGSRGAAPLDFYRLPVPAPAFWVLASLELLLAVLVALQVGNVFR